jgi:predicted phage replisome organizer
MAKKYYWLKLNEGFFDDKIIKKLRKLAGGDTYVIIYLKMQLLSIKTEGRLFFEGIEGSFDEELALDIDEDVDNVKVTLSYLEKLNLIESSIEDEYVLPGVLGLIGSESESAERVRRYRENKEMKLLQCNDAVTNSNDNVISCNTEIEIEKEKEIDKKKSNSRFAPPTTEEVKDYCRERKNQVDAERFIDFYESKGWMIGKNKMKDWKAAVRTWEKEKQPPPKVPGQAQPNPHNRFNQFPQRTYSTQDYEDLERKLLNKGL